MVRMMPDLQLSYQPQSDIT